MELLAGVVEMVELALAEAAHGRDQRLPHIRQHAYQAADRAGIRGEAQRGE